MKVKDIIPLINVYPRSEDYLKIYGIRVIYTNGQQTSFAGNSRYALSLNLTKKQRAYTEALIRDIES